MILPDVLDALWHSVVVDKDIGTCLLRKDLNLQFRLHQVDRTLRHNKQKQK